MVEQAPFFKTLGITEEMVEKAMCNIIAERVMAMGGKPFDPKNPKPPVQWSN